MRLIMLGGLLAAMCGSLALATTTDELMIKSGGLTATITDNGTCTGTGCGSLVGDTNSSAGEDAVFGTINGWAISITGASNSPGFNPAGLDVTSFTAVCTSGGCTGTSTLEIEFSDKNFNVPTPLEGFATSYTNTQTGSATTTTSASAFFSNLNTRFTETSLIGTNTFAGNGAGVHSTGPVAPGTYSLTLDETFSSDGATTFKGDANITAVPEPLSILLLGTVLCLSAYAFRRRLRSRNGHF